MKKLFIIPLLLILVSLSVKAQDYGNIHQLITEGTNYVFEIDFPNALLKFQEAKKQAPNDLRGPFFESTVYFWRTMFSKNRADYDQYLNLSDNLIKKCEDVTDKNENDLDAQFYKGWSYTMRAVALYMIDKKMLQAASDAKDGNKALQLVVEKNPNYYDAYMGLGIFNYMSSMIPRKLQWITGILGFSGDKATGLKQLVMASEKGTYTNTEAKFYLTLLSWREENYPSAEGYANQLKDAHPNSPAIWMLWGLLLSQQDKMNDAIEAYNKALQLNKDKQSDIVYKTVYGALSNAYFKTNQFDKAADFGKKYIALTNKDDNINNRLYSIGVSLELMGNRADAVNYYKLAKTEISVENEWEKFWLRKLNERVSKPVTQVDSLLIVADNNRSVGKFDDALANYESLKKITSSGMVPDDITVQINSGIGQVFYKQKEYNKAIEKFKLNLNLAPSNEKWLVPDSFFQIGKCYLKLGKKNEAQDYFDKALAIDYEYDFKDAMDNKVKNELSKY